MRTRADTVFTVAAVAVAAAVVVVLPFVVSSYRTYQLAQAGIYFVGVLGLNIVTGYSGQISLGHGAFMLIGAYTTTALVAHEHVRDLWTIPCAGVVAGAAGLVFGFPALRLTGVYLALATLALAIAAPQLAQRFPGLTGGGTGIHIPEARPPGGWSIGMNAWLYILSWSVAGVMLALAWLILRGRFGRALRAIRDSRIAAVSAGIDLPLYKTLAFGISAFYAGVSGSLLAISLAYISPASFPLALSILLLTGAVVGGLATLTGPILGGLLIMFLWVTPFYQPRLAREAPPVIYGLIVIVLMLVMPDGIIGLLRRLLRRGLARRGAALGRLTEPA